MKVIPLVDREIDTIATVEAIFREHWQTSAADYGSRVDVYRNAASSCAMSALAATYERLLSEAESAGGDRLRQIEIARAAWSRGFVAEAIDRFCRNTRRWIPSGRPHRGLLTAHDIAAWLPHTEQPVTYDYGRYTVCKAGFWSQGPVFCSNSRC